MPRCFKLQLLFLAVSNGLWFFSGMAMNWAQACPALQGCSTSIVSDADYATISGGQINVIGSRGDYATVGSRQNTASVPYATVGCGLLNAATTGAWCATVSGSYLNTVSGFGATVPGGVANNEDFQEIAKQQILTGATAQDSELEVEG